MSPKAIDVLVRAQQRERAQQELVEALARLETSASMFDEAGDVYKAARLRDVRADAAGVRDKL
jgi:hypothetical protein